MVTPKERVKKMAKRNSNVEDFASIMGDLAKKHGSDAVMTGADKLDFDFTFTPTGVVALDRELGGGFPHGMIIDIYGLQGSGKCVPRDALITTAYGLLTVEEIFHLAGLPLDTHQETEVPFEFPLINGDGLPESTSNFTTNGVREVFEITTKSGRRLRSTGNHPYWVVDGDDESWRETGQLVVGDQLLKVTDVNNSGDENNTFYEFTEDQAYVIGVLASQGIVNSSGRPELLPLSFIDTSALEEFFTSEGLAGMDLMPETTIEVIDGTHNGKFQNVMGLYHAWGTYPTAFAHRNIPVNIRMNTAEVLNAFVRGAVEANGSFRDDGSLVVKVQSRALAEQLQLVLENETVSTVVERVELAPGTEMYTWDIVFNPLSTAIYRVIFGTVWEEFWENAPSVGTTGEEEWSELDEIVSIVSLGDMPTFDFTLDDSHSFLMSGIKTHNTGLALSFLANMQKKGKKCVYLDQETAFEPSLAKLLGVDLDELIKIRLPSAEDNLNFIVKAAKSGEVGCIILDSVGNLSSEAELQGEIGDATVGKVGRLMAQVLRVLDKIDTEMVLVCINQTYANIGAMGNASKTVVGGGSKVKFAAFTRIHVKNIGQITDSSGAKIGQKTQFVIDKARLSMPGQKVEVDVLYGIGYDNEKDIIEAAVDSGIFEKKGNWYTDTRTGERWNGTAAMGAHIRETEGFSEALMEALDL